MRPIQQIRKLVLITAVLLLIAGGCNQTQTQTDTQNTNIVTSTETITPLPITYQGELGKTALEILRAKHEITTKEFPGVGEFVESINGVTPDSKHFWGFYVNGETSNVGAAQYITQTDDKIEWHLEEIK